MDDQALYQRWQEMFSELIIELGDRYDPRIIYDLVAIVVDKTVRQNIKIDDRRESDDYKDWQI